MATSRVSSEVDEWFRNETVTVRPKGASLKVFEGDFNLLDFCPTDDPAWRQGTALPRTREMVQDLRRWAEQYRSSSAAAAVLPAFQRHLAGRFIFFNNKAEGTGLENEGDTQRLLLEACADLPDKKSKEVLQMHEAMCFLQKIRLDRLQQGETSAESILITPEMVLKAHTILTTNLIERPGQLREEDSYAGVPGGGKFYFDPPHLVPSSFNTTLELYNALLFDMADKWDTLHSTTALYNLAALLFVQLITVHPFDDGNGRMLRLLANFVLSAITPFPIPAYVEDGIRTRRTYIDAVMAARNLADVMLTRVNPPEDLAALFIESAWQSWQELMTWVDRSTILQSLRGKLLASTFSPSHYNRLKDIGLSAQEKEAEIATIQQAIDDAKREATDIKPGHAHDIVVSLARDTFATVTLLKPRSSHG